MTSDDGASRAGRLSSSRSLRNNETLLDATLEIAATDGWAALSFLAVSERAGLSRRTLQSRFDDPSHLMATAWTQRAWPQFHDLFSRVLAAAGLLSSDADAAELGSVLNEAARPGELLLAGSELMLIAQFDAPMKTALLQTLGDALQQWCVPDGRRVTRTLAAQRAYILGATLGLVLFGRRPGSEKYDLTLDAQLLIPVLAKPTTPARLPSSRMPHLDRDVPFATGDPTTDALLQSALDLVGTNGFDGTRTEAIARRAGVSEGALFSRYSSKLELFRDAIARQVAIGVRANTEANDIIRAKHGWGIADAVMFREFMRPSRAHQRAITLEGVRVSWHYPDVMSATMAELDEFLAQEMAADPTRRAESYHLGYAQGTGILVLPLVLESCYELPFDVVSVPDLG